MDQNHDFQRIVSTELCTGRVSCLNAFALAYINTGNRTHTHTHTRLVYYLFTNKMNSLSLFVLPVCVCVCVIGPVLLCRWVEFLKNSPFGNSVSFVIINLAATTE